MISGAMLCARSEWRRRWVILFMVTALIAVGGGAGIAAAAAAHRTDTAFERYSEQLRSADLQVSGQGPEGGFGDLDPELLDRVMEVEGVKGLREVAFMFVAPESYPNFFAVALIGHRGESPRLHTVDGKPFETIEEFGVDELVINEAMSDELGKGVGDEVQLLSLSPPQVAQLFDGQDFAVPEGPTVDSRIVSIVRDAEEISDAPDPFIVLPPAYYDAYADAIGNCRCVVELNVDPAQLTSVETQLADIYPTVEIQRSEDLGARLADTVSLQSRAWWAMALAAAVATLVALYQACREVVKAMMTEDEPLQALGMTRRGRQLTRMLVLLPCMLAGAAAAAGVAYVLSPLSPVGVTRRAELEPGLRWDSVTILTGLFVVAALSAVAVALAVLGTGRRERRNRMTMPMAGPVTSLGSRMAFGPGRGAIVGLTVATAGLVGAMTLHDSIDQDLATPALFGADFDAAAMIQDGQDRETVASQLADDPDVQAVGLLLAAADENDEYPVSVVGPDGSTAIVPVAIESREGVIDVIVRAGRPPARPGEVAVGHAVLETVGASLGETIDASSDIGTVELTITGELIDPGTDTTDRGFAMTPDGLATLVEPVAQGVVVRLEPGADLDAVVARHADTFLRTVEPPSEIGHLAELGGLPLRVGQLLAVLGAFALLSAIVQTVRRGRRDLAVHRALGFTRRQVLGAHLCQALITAAIGLLIGVGTGIVIGRSVMRALMISVGALPQTHVPSTVWTTSALLLLACLIAGFSAGAVALRNRPGAVLRAE